MLADPTAQMNYKPNQHRTVFREKASLSPFDRCCYVYVEWSPLIQRGLKHHYRASNPVT